MTGLFKRKNFVFRTFFHFLDPIVIFVGTFLLHGAFRAEGLGPEPLVRTLAVYGPLFVILIFPLFHMYRSWRGESLLLEIKAVAVAWCAVLLVFNAFIILLATGLEREVLWPYGLFKLDAFWLWAGWSLLLLTSVRLWGRLLFRMLRRWGYNKRSAIVVGADDLGLRVADYLEEHPWMGIEVLGFFDDREKGRETDGEARSMPRKVLGRVEDCEPYVLGSRPDFVIIALPAKAARRIDNLIWNLGTSGVNVLMVPDLFSFGLKKPKLQNLGDIPVVAFNLFPVWKRIFDLVFSTGALLALAPLFLGIALLIKLEGRGPIFYGHRRIGETGQPFGCLKFRTMHVNADRKLEEILARDPAARAEWEKTYKLKNDPRITRIGRFLRKTSLDELPQFINVVRGEMSVVGARPVVNEELYKYYKKEAIAYCSMKPGVTGPWQVGKRSDTENYLERVDLDHWYVLNSSIWLDLRIIFTTVYKVFNGRGAY
jgi:putative colanic acid biosysnthesis UDP-glucose lipid carrier transferase